jgi:hypothetical protein
MVLPNKNSTVDTSSLNLGPTTEQTNSTLGHLVVAFFIYAFKRRWIVYRRSAAVAG